MRAALERQAQQLDIQANVHFLGFRRDLPEIYADLDIVALSSLNEGLPVTLIEAQAAGRPVVATAVGGVSDLVQHEIAGLVTPPRDSAAFAQGLLRLLALSPEERAQMGRAGQAAVYPKYHISTLINNIAALYDDILRRKGLQ